MLWAKDHEEFDKAKSLIFQIIENFDEIQDAEHEAATISGMSLFYLALADENFEVMKDFIVKNLQHPDGRIREAAKDVGDWLYCSLAHRADPYVYPKGKPLSDKQKSEQIIARGQYTNFVNELEALIDRYGNDEDDDVEYIDEMKPSIHKSLQKMWSRLTDTPAYRRLIEQSHFVLPAILARRQEIEEELTKLLKMTKSDFDLEDIKLTIFNEQDSSDLAEVVRMLDTGHSFSELSNILEVVEDAWNYFPHRILNGRCPAEMLLEYRSSQEIGH